MEDKKETPNTFRPIDGIKRLEKPGSSTSGVNAKSEQVPFEIELQQVTKNDSEVASKSREEESGFNTFRPGDGIKPLPKPNAWRQEK